MAPISLSEEFSVAIHGEGQAMTRFHSLRLSSMVPYIDIHTHHQTTDKEIISVLNRSFDEEVVSTCSTGEAAHCSKREVSLCSTGVVSLYSLGIHPYLTINAETDPGFISRSIRMLKDKASMNEIIAIGEAGIDALKGAGMDVQEEIFRHQIEIAEGVKKPLIIHCVKSIDEIIRLKKELCPKQPWIMHGYRKNEQTARQLIGHGIELSFGQRYNVQALRLTYSTSRIWLETDEDCIDIREHYQNVAQALNIPVDELKLKIYEQATELSSAFLRV